MSTTTLHRAGRALRSAAAAPMVRSGAASITLRCATLGGKLAFLLYIGRHLTVEDMAVYGLMATTVGIAVTLLGWEFYAFSTREILGRSEADRAVLLRDQLVFHALAYAALLPLALPVFATGVLAWRYALWFYALAILEHLSQESARLFNTLFRPVLSSALFFVRSAAWAIVIVAIGWWRPGTITITAVFAFWTAASAMGLVLAWMELRRLDWSAAASSSVDWTWIRQGLGVAGPFFVSALSYRVIELADRYIIHFMLTDTAVGVYSFYGTIANIIPAVIGAGVSAILVPRIIAAFQAGRSSEYRQYFRTLNIATIAVSVASVPVVYLTVGLLQPYLGKPEYARELGSCLVLLVSTSVSVIAQLPGVALYARKDDRALLIAVLLGAVVNTVLNVLLIPVMGIVGAAWATTIAYGAMGGYQMYRLARITRVQVS